MKPWMSAAIAAIAGYFLFFKTKAVAAPNATTTVNPMASPSQKIAPPITPAAVSTGAGAAPYQQATVTTPPVVTTPKAGVAPIPAKTAAPVAVNCKDQPMTIRPDETKPTSKKCPDCYLYAAKDADAAPGTIRASNYCLKKKEYR